MELLCRLLEVSRSGYYEWLHRKDSAHMQQDQALKRQLLAFHQRYPALGLDSLYHLIYKELSCSRKRIHRLMNELGISSARKRVYKTTTNSRHAHPIAPNLLARHFSFDKPSSVAILPISPPMRAGSIAPLTSVNELSYVSFCFLSLFTVHLTGKGTTNRTVSLRIFPIE